MATLNVQTDYGAAGDGTTDDTDAIQQAIDDATAGDEVYLPAATYLVSRRQDSGIGHSCLDFQAKHGMDDVTFRGDGADTIVKCDGGHDISFTNGPAGLQVMWVSGDGIQGLTLKDFAVDGNRSAQSGDLGDGHGISINGGSTTEADITITNVLIENCVGAGLELKYGQTTATDCTTRNSYDHGIVVDAPAEDGPIDVKRCLVTQWDVAGRSNYGFDRSRGTGLVEDCVAYDARGNGQGAKTTGESDNITFRRVRINGANWTGLQRPGDTGSGTDVTIEDFIAENCGNHGFRIGAGTTYTVPSGSSMISTNNDGDYGVWMVNDADIAADGTIYVNNSDVQNPLNAESGATGYISSFQHTQNTSESLIQNNVDVQSTGSTLKTDIDGVPTRDDVGAFSSGGGGSTGPTTHDVTDYGAVADGTTDDTAAIQDAIDAAEAGDTVYFPASVDPYAVYGGGSICTVDVSSGNTGDITLKGDGPGSKIAYAGGNATDEDYRVLAVRGGPSNFTLQDLQIDGGSESVNGDPSVGSCLAILDGSGDTSGQSYSLTHVRLQNAYRDGLEIAEHNVTADWVTARNNGGHGLRVEPDEFTADTAVITNSRFENNGVTHNVPALGLESGSPSIEDSVVASSDGTGVGSSGTGVLYDGTLRRVRVTGSGGHGWDATTANGTQILEDCVFGSSNSENVRLGGCDYRVTDGSELVVTNNSDSGGRAGILVSDGGDLDASNATVWSNNNDNEGLATTSSGSGTIDTYNYANNESGAYGGTSDLTVSSEGQSEKLTISGVPVLSDVGAWNDSTSGPSPPTGGLSATSGIIDSSNGVLLSGNAAVSGSVSVSTTKSDTVDTSSATLYGSLDAMGQADSVDVSFEYDKVGGSLANSVDAGTLSSTGSFQATVDGLADGTDYEFRAVAEASSSSDTGSTLTFTTSSIKDTLTVLDDFESYTVGNSIVTEAAEWGTTASLPEPVVSDNGFIEGTQEAGFRASDGSWWSAMSTTDPASNDNQSATFSSYPGAGSTVRMGVRVEQSTSTKMELAVGVPSSSDDYRLNSYRCDCSTDRTMTVRQSVDFNHTELASSSTTLSVDTVYDFAVEFEDTGSEVNITFTIWEWTGSSWTQVDQITGTDSSQNHATNEGIAVTGSPDFDSSTGFHIDNLRMYSTLGENGEPIYTP